MQGNSLSCNPVILPSEVILHSDVTLVSAFHLQGNILSGFLAILPSQKTSLVPTSQLHEFGIIKQFIATDKREYPHNIFLISQRKHMLWVLIRSTSLRRF